MLTGTMMTGNGMNFSGQMTLKIMIATLIVILQLCHHQAEGFNLWKNGSIRMEGPRGSKFGYSVSLWSDAGANKRLVIGAPRGNNHPKLGPTKYELGNIYLCGLTSQCSVDERLPIVSSQDGSQDALDRGFSMRKYGMGFGEALSSLKQDGSPLAACAPRYPRSKTNFMQSRGACFFIEDTQANPKVIVPYTRKNLNYKTFENALMGFSVALINETSPTVVIGGPGALYGEGVVVNKPIYSGGFGTVSRLKNKKTQENGASYEGWQVAQGMFDGQNTSIVVSAVNFANNKGKVKLYPKELEYLSKNANNFQKEIYGKDVGAKFGYSLGVGDFDNDGMDDLLVGSPWAPVKKPSYLPDAGKVFVYYSPILKKNREPQEISGSDAWGNFGLSVSCLGDINMDGYADAAVAAPYAGSDNSGIIYIYNGSPEGLIQKPTQVIRASDFSGEMTGFGFSIDGGIDMDNNGYPDVLVGSVHSNQAVFLRSAPVVTLVGSVSFKTNAGKVDDKTCNLDQAGYKKVKGVCFYMDVELRYDSHTVSSDIDVVLRMVLEDQADPPQFVFKVTNDISYRREVILKKEKPIKNGEVIFAKSDRSIIGKPVKVSVSVHLVPPEDVPIDDLELSPVPPVLDVLSQTTFNTSVILTCDNNKTCFSKPDMAISAFPTTLVVGDGPIGLPVLLEVRNDPAYEVEVTVNHPSPLKYQRVEGDGLIPDCKYSRLVGVLTYSKFICRFNFVEADEKVNFTLFFEHQPLALMEHLEETGKDHVTIDLKVHSDSKDTDDRDNKYASKLQVNTRANLYTEGESLPETMAVKVNQTLSTEEIERASQSDTNTFPAHRLGPKITQHFALTNQGPSPVKGAKLELQLVLYRGDDRILYLLEEPSTSAGITCAWPKVNPWNIQDTEPESSQDQDLSNSTDTSQDVKSRKRRQTEKGQGPVPGDPTYNKNTADPSLMSSEPEDPLHSPQSPNDHQNQSDKVEYVAPRDFLPPRKARSYAAPEGAKYIDCNLPKCQVICEVSLLNVGEQVSIDIPGYLVIASLDKHGHRKLGVRSWVTAKVAQSGSQLISPSSSAKTFVTLLKPPESGLSAVPFWLLLLAVLGSLLLILVIMALLWRAGFFKRNRPPVDPNRRSLVRSDYPPPSKDLQEMAAMQD